MIHEWLISCNTTGHVVMENPPPEEITEESEEDLPPEIEQILGKDLKEAFDLDKTIHLELLSVSESDSRILKILDEQYKDEEITIKGLNVRRNKVLSSYIRTYLDNGGEIATLLAPPPKNVNASLPKTHGNITKTINNNKGNITKTQISHGNNTKTQINLGGNIPKAHSNITKTLVSNLKHSNASASAKNETRSHLRPKRHLLSLVDDKIDDTEENSERVSGTADHRVRAGQRRLLDAFGDSLLHVNRLYSDTYGHSSRKVPAHMPIFIDNEVLKESRLKFIDQWKATSSHAFR